MMMTTTTTVVILIVSLSLSIESGKQKVLNMYYYGDGYKCAMITKI